MLLNIVLVLAVLLVAFLIAAALQSPRLQIQRSTVISAPPTVAFAQVNDLHRWEAWSPWAKLDPNMKQTYDGAPSGVGATTSWVGNKEVGEGRMTIVESRPAELVRIKLEFLKPFAATNEATFTFQPESAGTRVQWTMSGERNFVCKAIGLVMNMEKMVGRQFEQGLAQMKTLAEAPATTAVAQATPLHP